MKVSVMHADGKKGKEIELPSFFSDRVREDIIAKIVEIEKRQQPFGVF